MFGKANLVLGKGGGSAAKQFRAPVKTLTIKEKLMAIPDFPEEAASIIDSSVFKDQFGQIIPLFAAFPFVKTPQGLYVLEYHEIISAVAVYDNFAMQWQRTGQKHNPVQLDEYGNNVKDVADDAPTQEEAIEQFKHYIGNLVLIKQKKIRNDTLIDSDSIYHMPALQLLREDEIKRINLDGRKKIPTKGNCKRKGCKSTEVHIEIQTLRSGDEGGVLITRCDLCDFSWQER
tara:strand:- start:74933 stop:75625 length:693 start_codon:yes stop_codon:yes gene_type:complete